MINTADLDSRMVKGQHGFLQGYNAQAAANEQQIVILTADGIPVLIRTESAADNTPAGLARRDL